MLAFFDEKAKKCYSPRYWRRGRVVERAALEMRYVRKGIGGSNPPASARLPSLNRGEVRHLGSFYPLVLK